MKIIEIKKDQLYLQITRQTRGVQDYNIKIKQEQPINSIHDVLIHIRLIQDWYKLYSSENEYKNKMDDHLFDLGNINLSIISFLEENKQGELVNKYIANLKFTLDIRNK